jgi:hypothetical protein
MGHSVRNAAEGPAMSIQHLQEGVRAIAQEMPAVGDLDRLWCPLSDPIRIGPGAIPGDDLDAGVITQPRRKRGGLAVRQEIDDLPPLEIAHDGAVPLSAAPRPIIDPENARRLARLAAPSAADEAQQRGRAHRQAQALGQAGPGLPAEREAKVALNITEAIRAPAVRASNPGKALGEDPTRASCRGAPQAPGPDLNGDGPTLPRQIGECAGVVTVQPVRRATARWTWRPGRSRAGQDEDAVGFGNNLIDDQASRDERQQAFRQRGA